MEEAWPERPTNGGRVFESSRQVRLSDTGPTGVLRLDAIARYLQDAATDDSDDGGFATGPGSGHVWVVRHTAIRRVTGATWPGLGDAVGLATWCGGIGRAWAVRRTDISTADGPVVQTSALWVHLDDRGRPARLDERFLATYAAAAEGRSASARVPAPPEPGAGATHTPWPIRAADLDVVGHVNNAAVWTAMVEATAGVAPTRLRAAELVHHGSIETGDPVELSVETIAEARWVWLTVEGSVRASGRLSLE